MALSSRKKLHHVNFVVLADGFAERPRSVHKRAVHGDAHMLSERAPVVEDIAAKRGVPREDGVERLAHRAGGHFRRRARDVAQKIRRERDARHGLLSDAAV
jgi:hypothetical protein